MIKPKTGRILRHVTLWTLWIAYEFFGYYDRLDQFTPLLWAKVIYNCLSLIAATYIAYDYALKFFRSNPSIKEFWSLPPADKYKLLANRYLFGIGFVIVGYMGLSFWLDSEYFGIQDGEIVIQLKVRFSKLRELLGVALVYSYLKIHVFQANQQLDIANWRIKLYQDTTDYLKLLFEKLSLK